MASRARLEHPDPTSCRSGRLLVVGFGSSLRADDAVGLAVAEILAAGPTPDGVRVTTAGSDALRLPSLWQGEPRIWLVDAVIRGQAPGSLHILEHDDVLAVPQKHATVHQLSLPESIRWINLTYPEMATVRYRLWGIEPGSLELEEGLSPKVTEAATRIAEMIRVRW